MKVSNRTNELERTKLKVVGNQVFPFEEGGKAIEHIAAGKVQGKVVVRVARATKADGLN